MTYTGTMMKELLAITDNAVELSRRARGETWHERYFNQDVKPDPIEILLHARTHLCNWGMENKGDIAAWWDLGWIQDRVIFGSGQCATVYEDGHGCQVDSATFCGMCGRELCLAHSSKCCVETFCDFCLKKHAKGHPQ